MKVFLSWSGDRSRRVARTLREWLPLVLQHVEPWMSEKDIEAGERWGIEIGKKLEESFFGVICLTKENLTAPWILFEAGALSKIMASSAVCPYLLGLDFGDITGPLSQFQAKKASKEHTRALVESINKCSIEQGMKGLDGNRLGAVFEGFWPQLERDLHEIPAAVTVSRGESPIGNRPQHEILDELVEIVRSVDRRICEVKAALDGGMVLDQPSYETTNGRVGQAVRHVKFGSGIVVDIDGGTDPIVTAKFAQWGVKRIKARFLEFSESQVDSGTTNK
ncbi:TIR domain-containing protein [Polyangium jinanense]|nr:TIR domain-containing protein [Polyangium jinanense]